MLDLLWVADVATILVAALAVALVSEYYIRRHQRWQRRFGKK